MHAEVFLAASHLLVVLERNLSRLTGYLWILTAVVYKGWGGCCFQSAFQKVSPAMGIFLLFWGEGPTTVLCSDNQACEKGRAPLSYKPF